MPVLSSQPRSAAAFARTTFRTSQDTGLNKLYDDRRDRPHQNCQIEPRGQVPGVPDVHLDHLSKRCFVLSIDLPISRKTGQRIDSFSLPVLVTLKFVGGARTRADEAHLAPQHVEKLR